VLQLLDVLRPWQGFYSLIGTASATLVGLLFVAASVGSGVYTQDKQHAARAFLSPTVVHFSSVLAASMVAIMPTRSWVLCGLLIGGEGVLGFVYAVFVFRSMVRHALIAKLDAEDRIWYATLPAVGYMVITAAGTLLLFRVGQGCELLAAALCLLLLIGVRNAWDMTLWTVMRHGE